jgi:hypothetical protein
MPIGASYGGGFLPSSVTGVGLPNKDNVLKGGGMGVPQVDPAGGLYGGVANTGGVNPGGGLSRIGSMELVGNNGMGMPGGMGMPPMGIPTPMGGLPPGIPPVQGPGSLLGNMPTTPQLPPLNRRPGPSVGGAGPYGGIMGGQNVQRNRPTRNPSIPTGGIDPRPAQGDLMRGIRGKGGMSMF